MGINSLEIKDKTNYDLDNICYIDDFDVNSLKITKKESRIGANIYYTRCALNLDDDDTIIPLHFLINRLIGFIEEIDRSNDRSKIPSDTSRLFKPFEFPNGSRISDEKLVILEFKYLRTKNGRNKL